MIDCNDFQGEDFDKLVFDVVTKVREVGKVDMDSNKGYSHTDLVNSIRFTLEEVHKYGSKKGCGKDIKVPFDSEHPEKGGDIVKCCKTWLCSECSEKKSKEKVE